MHLPRDVRASSGLRDVAQGCGRFHDDLSGFVDETLTPRRWDEVAIHLAGCVSCRKETAEIRELRSALSNARSVDVDAPASLADRLEAIAGDDSDVPIYWGSEGPSTLPSKRRTRQRFVLRGSAAVLTLAMGVVVLAVVLAPGPRRLDNTVDIAREQFAQQITAVNVQESVGALLLAQDKGAQFPVVQHAEVYGVPSSPALPISRTAADAMLSRGATSYVGLGGVQEVYIATDDGGGYVRGNVAVTHVAGRGSELVVFDRDGNRFSSSFAPDYIAGVVQAPDSWDFYVYPSTVQLAGRPTMELEARSGAAVVARWWLDVATGITLRSERFGTSEQPTIVFGYGEVRLGEVALSEDAPRAVSLSKATTSGARGWCVGLTTCPNELAGLPLVAYSSTSTQGEQTMSLVYSNGFQTLSVRWMEGRLAEGEAVSAAAVTGLPSVTAWQAGRGVVSVTTNGSQKLLAEAVEELPDRAPYDRGLGARLVAGLGRLTGLG